MKGAERILSMIEALGGLRSGDGRRRRLREALFDFERQRTESLTEFVTRRAGQFGRATRHGLVLPEETKGLILIEGARLEFPGQQNLQTLLARAESFGLVPNAFRRLDTTARQKMTRPPTARGGNKGVFVEEKRDIRRLAGTSRRARRRQRLRV